MKQRLLFSETGDSISSGLCTRTDNGGSGGQVVEFSMPAKGFFQLKFFFVVAITDFLSFFFFLNILPIKV